MTVALIFIEVAGGVFVFGVGALAFGVGAGFLRAGAVGFVGGLPVDCGVGVRGGGDVAPVVVGVVAWGVVSEGVEDAADTSSVVASSDVFHGRAIGDGSSVVLLNA